MPESMNLETESIKFAFEDDKFTGQSKADGDLEYSYSLVG